MAKKINNAQAIVLLIVLLFIHITHYSDNHVKNIRTAITILTRIDREKTPIGEIKNLLKGAEGPNYVASSQGHKGFSLDIPDSKMKYYFYASASGDDLVSMGSEEQFHLPKGVTYEMLEKLYVRELTRYFRFPPKIETVPSIRWDHTRRSFTWNNIELYIVFDNVPDVSYERISKLSIFLSQFGWEKRSIISVNIIYRLTTD